MKQRTLSIVPRTLLVLGIATIALLGASAPAVRADTPGAHPYYLHAIADLRAARAYLSTIDEQNVEQDKGAAIIEIDRAITMIWRAAQRDQKSVEHPTHIDARLSHHDRFTRALILLGNAHRDLSAPESNRANLAIRNVALGHVDQASRDVHQAISNDRADDRGAHG